MQRSDPTRKAGPPEWGAEWHAPMYEKARELIKRHMEKKKLDAIRKLNAQMDKKWKSLAERVPYGLLWMNKSAELLDWYYLKRKEIREKEVNMERTEAHIHIEPDGLVWVKTKDGYGIGLGDIDVDVFIDDKREKAAQKDDGDKVV